MLYRLNKTLIDVIEPFILDRRAVQPLCNFKKNTSVKNTCPELLSIPWISLASFSSNALSFF